jgi:hypothetical protein
VPETRTNLEKAARRGAYILPHYKRVLSSQVSRTAHRHPTSRPEVKAIAFAVVQDLCRQLDTTLPNWRILRTRWNYQPQQTERLLLFSLSSSVQKQLGIISQKAWRHEYDDDDDLYETDDDGDSEDEEYTCPET